MGYKNKSLIIGMMLFPLSAMAGFIHPMDFDGSEAQKQEVIQYIKDRVQQDYCESQLDMCQPSMLRMMEDQNLSSFKEATQATDRKIMDRVIKDYCNSPIDMCNYDNILMMYNENLKASKKQLTW